jgi:hypothetical protein
MEVRDAYDGWQSVTKLEQFGNARAAHAGGTVWHILKGVILYMTDEACHILWCISFCKT